MKEWIAFLLPPAVAFAGMRLSRLLLGQKFEERFGFGLRLHWGWLGMLVFSQAVLLAALAGVNLGGVLAWRRSIWGAAEVVLCLPKVAAGLKGNKFRPGHLWLLLLLPVIYSWWVFGRLSTLEGTLEFDANAFWVFKAKILYLEQGKNLLNMLHQSSLGYAHWIIRCSCRAFIPSTMARLAVWTNSSTKSGRSGWWWRCAWEFFHWGKSGNTRIRCPF